ncbi:MAG: CocE/NonD family hydrolase [Xanthomonadales bacterium]|nr:CocE/NonD family hydrolase [Xanthomonadales bacterium]
MRTRTEFPHEVDVVENAFIPMPDGARLAARIWRPVDAPSRPVPALLEYLPYRKRDLMRARDEPMHRYLAQHGYACLRVDLRGCGDSDGLLDDEYTRQEHLDGVEVIAWIARQPWCSGAVGMFGISWGGFNSLQIAALQPPELKAIITVCAADDRFTDDAHYMGGCLLTENLQWGAIFMLNQALPADPALVGKSWREQWRERLDHLPNFPALWLEHPWRDQYWSAGSVRDHIERIRIPVYAIGGWADAYSNAVPRLVASLKSPCKGLIGPWAHTFPHLGIPGPAIGFLQESIRWWDRWLKGIENGIEDEPVLRAWMQDSVPPAPQYEHRPGRWIAEDSWPSPNVTDKVFFLNRGELGDEPAEPEARTICSPQICGMRGGEWCGFGSDGEMPRDQRPDDGLSMVFDSRRLRERTEIFGAPRVRLALRCDQPLGNLIVRLCDVAPDGTSARVTYGVLNLAHRENHAEPSALDPDHTYTIDLALNDIAHSFPVGHRIRVALSTAYWPILWPAPAPVSLRIVTGRSRLLLPVRPPRKSDADLPDFEPPAMAPAPSVERVRFHEFKRRLAVDLTANTFHYELNGSEFDAASMVYLSDIDLKVGYTLNKWFDIQEDDPLSARATIEQKATLARGDWLVNIEMTMTQTADAESFHIRGQLRAREAAEEFATRDWELSIPRRLV